MRLTKLLAFRLFLIILLVMAVGTGLFTTLNLQWQSRQHMDATLKTAARLSDIIKRSTHYSMLLNRREDIRQIIATTGNEEGIEAIRIYNKRGVVAFSSIGTEQGKEVSRSSEACAGCHEDPAGLQSYDHAKLSRVFSSPQGVRLLGMITPIYNEPSCSSAPCHAHPEPQTILGVLDVLVPLRDLDHASAESQRVQYTNALFLVLAVCAVTGLFLWMMVTVPVRHLTHGTREIIKGNLAYRIPVRSGDEIGLLADSFNSMTDELARARREILIWTETLEQRVADKTGELKRAQQNLIHVEKMASLGQLAATVAHELNNPLEGVLTYAKLIRKSIASGFLSEEKATELQGELSLIAEETARCGGIVKNLLLFSKAKIGEIRQEDLRLILDRTVKLIDHHLKLQNISLVVEGINEPVTAQCDPQEIEQALLAFEMNAIEAMPGGGKLRLQLCRDAPEDRVRIVVQDTGCGIRDKDLPYIFEPFFTTKENGKGTGLGLTVAYGIMQRHGGTIDVHSLPGIGTTFTLTFPISAPLRPAEQPFQAAFHDTQRQ